ncbi:outer membrane protein assembly factor BamE [Alteromonas sp. ASW11-130]|uniref:outer membrane protein assembly factor BamE n=1 Tax=Alteromonas sp. ASW11-130 TaxID=3015775 RepID=UPI00224273A7|nr:outer membrane protein assembly factor BamE [Alteromonas sp. ASW11-130]MCW8091420.1 outer membrane protein assembly factor BamE [Alteromonas sp. ASW11-130]
MKLLQSLFIITFISSLAGCTDWIYRIDVPQGNFLEEKDVKKLRIGMSKEQVIYVLGRPVVKDSFNHDTWYYVYDMKRGMSKRGEDFQKRLIIQFEEDKLISAEGDFELSDDFNTPLDK